MAEQDRLAAQALSRVLTAAADHPHLEEDEGYARCMSAIDSCSKMVHTSRLIYNDSVTRLNRELRMFPTFLLAGALGIRPKDYLE